MYTTNDHLGINTGQVVQANLKAIGLDVEVKPYTFAVLIDKTGTRGEPFDMWSIGWFADYPDPYNFVNILLDGRSIGPKNNINTAYFNMPAYNRKMDAAAAWPATLATAPTATSTSTSPATSLRSSPPETRTCASSSPRRSAVLRTRSHGVASTS